MTSAAMFAIKFLRVLAKVEKWKTVSLFAFSNTVALKISSKWQQFGKQKSEVIKGTRKPPLLQTIFYLTDLFKAETFLKEA